DRPTGAKGVALTPLAREGANGKLSYSHVDVEIDRERRVATLILRGPSVPAPKTAAEALAQGAAFWPLALARELEDAILNLRVNEPSIGLVLVRTDGDAQAVLS